MIDLIKIRVDRHESDNTHLLSGDLDLYFDDWERSTNKKGGMRTVGRLKNLNIYVDEAGTTIQGSVPKFIDGHNLLPTGFSGLGEFASEVSQKLNIDLRPGKITTIEIGANLIMDHPCSLYYQSLGSIPRLKKYDTYNLKYDNTTTAIKFYDKKKEVQEQQKPYSDLLFECPLLRYEVTFKVSAIKAIAKIFKIDKITVDNFSPLLFLEFVRKWREKFYSIIPTSKPAFSIKGITQPKEFWDEAKKYIVNHIGSHNLINMIDSTEKGQLRTEYKSRLRAEIRRYDELGADTGEFSPYRELTNKIDMKLSQLEELYRKAKVIA